VHALYLPALVEGFIQLRNNAEETFGNEIDLLEWPAIAPVIRPTWIALSD
jgi:hypothetical protein